MFSSVRRSLFGTDIDQRQALAKFDPNRPISREEQVERFFKASYALYWQAERSRQRALSYRHFCVACAVWAYREDLPLDHGRFRPFYGVNIKVLPGARNTCAEPVALGGALSFAYTDAVGIVIVGNTQADERGATPPTLRPCKECRLFMRNCPLIKPDTIVVTAQPPPHAEAEWNEIPHEVHTFQELSSMYAEV